MRHLIPDIESKFGFLKGRYATRSHVTRKETDKTPGGKKWLLRCLFSLRSFIYKETNILRFQNSKNISSPRTRVFKIYKK